MPEVLMPRLSDTMTEGTLVQWLKREGDEISRGDVIAEVETDKATMEVEAYSSGVLSRIIVAPGAVVAIGAPIAVIGDAGGGDGAAGGSAPAAPDMPARVSPAVTATAAAAAAAAPGAPAHLAPAGARILTSPLARSLARQHDLDLSRVVGTGPGGRIVRADVEAAIATAVRSSAPAERTSAATAGSVAEDERIPLSAVRRVTAQRLSRSAAVPNFSLTSIVDAGALLALRAELNAALADTGPKITVTDLLVRACALMLRDHPQLNSSWADDHLVRHGRVDIGVAVALDDGLIVPVLRDAAGKGVVAIALEARALAERARAGRLTPDEFTGGTFTISNLGTFGIDHFTAVINPPEAGILAVGVAHEEAVVRDGALAVATVMKLTLSVDHRVLDGATAAAFLRDLVGLLEHPLRLLV